MGSPWAVAGAGIALGWLLAFAAVAGWELGTAEPFSPRGGQPGLPYPWTAAVVVVGGPVALLASAGCSVAAAFGRPVRRSWTLLAGPVAVVVGGLVLYLVLGLLAAGGRR